MKWLSVQIIVVVIAVAAGAVSSGADENAGIAAFEARDYAEANRVFESVLGQQADDATALYYLGRIRFEHSDLDQARKYLEKLTEVAPNNAEYEFRLSQVYGELARTSGFFLTKKKFAGKWKERLERAVELDPTHVKARRWLALYLLNAPGFGGGDKDRGTQIARETIAIDEEAGRLTLAYAYRKIGQPERALEECETLLASAPDLGTAYGGIGWARLQMNEFDAARQAFERWIELDPDNYEAYEAMAYFCGERELTDEKMTYQRQLLERNPLYSDARYELATAYDERDAIEDAVYHYEALVSLTPEHRKAGDAKKRLKKLKNPKRYGR